jgi:hypothetical protein
MHAWSQADQTANASKGIASICILQIVSNTMQAAGYQRDNCEKHPCKFEHEAAAAGLKHAFY